MLRISFNCHTFSFNFHLPQTIPTRTTAHKPRSEQGWKLKEKIWRLVRNKKNVAHLKIIKQYCNLKEILRINYK